MQEEVIFQVSISYGNCQPSVYLAKTLEALAYVVDSWDKGYTLLKEEWDGSRFKLVYPDKRDSVTILALAPSEVGVYTRATVEGVSIAKALSIPFLALDGGK